MIGGPGETNETLQSSLDFVLNNLRKNGRAVTHVAQFFIGVHLIQTQPFGDSPESKGS